MNNQFKGIPRNHFRAILVDPPWLFKNLWGDRPDKDASRSIEKHYSLMENTDIRKLPIRDLAADDAVLFIWATWPMLPDAIDVLQAWEFKYKTCAFIWIKAQSEGFFLKDKSTFMSLGYWTRANSEPCLLATIGKPKRMGKDVRQVIISPRRQHSRKPDETHTRIERLVDGPYLELFARRRRKGWTSWGNEIDRFQPISR